MIKKGISLKEYFYISTWSVAITSVGVAWISDVLSQDIKLIFPILLGLSLYSARSKMGKIKKTALSTICWCGVVLSFLQIFLSRDVVMIGNVMVYLIWSHIHFIDRKSRFTTLMGSSLILCFSALVLDPGAISYILFLLYLVLVSLSLNAANFYLNLRFKSERRIILGRNYFFQIVKSAPIGIIISLGVFFLFPRMNQMYLDMPFEVKQRYRVGYNGNIDLGQQGQIEQDNSVVLSISSPQKKWLERNATDLYLKGGSLDRFDGTRWTKSLSERKPYYKFQLLQENRNLDRANGVILNIMTNPLRNNVIMLPYGRFSLMKISKTILMMFYDAREGALTREDDSPQRYQYTVQVYEHKPFEDRSIYDLSESISKNINKEHRFSIDEAGLKPYLEVPESLTKSDIFQDWKKQVGVSSKLSVMMNMKAIRTYFRRNYRASLINTFSSKSTFLDFLSNDRRGHCEYFSTASVMLLRSLDIPSRIATGYRGGDYNKLAGAVLVRQLHAHAWVEFFVPGLGWTLFDPTPPISEQFSLETNHFATRYLYAANYWLNKYLVDYNLLTQRDILGRVRESLPKSSVDTEFNFSLTRLIFLSLIVIIGGIGFWWWHRNRKTGSRPRYISKFYRFIKSQGSLIEKESFETYRSFGDRLGQEGVVSRELVIKFVNIVEDDLYGPSTLQAEIRDRIDEFQSTISRRKTVSGEK